MQTGPHSDRECTVVPAPSGAAPELPRVEHLTPRVMTMQFITLDMRYPAALANTDFATVTSNAQIAEFSQTIVTVHRYLTKQLLVQHRSHGIASITAEIESIAASVDNLGAVVSNVLLTDKDEFSPEALEVIRINQDALKASFASIEKIFFELTDERISIRPAVIDPAEMRRLGEAARRMPAS